MFDPRSDAPPHPTVQKSLLFNLVANGRNRHAKVDERYFREVFSSKYVAFFLRLWHPHLIFFSSCRYGLLRVYQIKDVDAKSKAWLANPRNRKCDRPGSWYCPGQYPPAVKPPPSKHRGIDYEVSSSFCPCFASSLLTLLLNRKKGIISRIMQSGRDKDFIISSTRRLSSDCLCHSPCNAMGFSPSRLFRATLHVHQALIDAKAIAFKLLSFTQEFYSNLYIRLPIRAAPPVMT